MKKKLNKEEKEKIKLEKERLKLARIQAKVEKKLEKKKSKKVDEKMDRADMYEFILKNHNKGLDSDYLIFMMRMELSDIIFDQHQHSYMPVNLLIIGIQLFLVVLSVIVDALCQTNIALTCAGINIGLCGVVAFNNVVHTIQWEKAKKRLRANDFGFELLKNRSKEELLDTLINKYKIDLSKIDEAVEKELKEEKDENVQTNK